MDTASVKSWMRLFLGMLQEVETENEALRLALRLRGVRHKELQAQLNKLRECRALKRRIEATIAPARKQIEAIFGEIESKENLAGLPVKADKLQ